MILFDPYSRYELVVYHLITYAFLPKYRIIHLLLDKKGIIHAKKIYKYF